MTNRKLHIGAGVQGGGTFANAPLGAAVPEEMLEFRWGEAPTYVTSTGTWTVPEDYEGYVLAYAVGGGGDGNAGGSSNGGGGGGAGGCALSIFKTIPGTVFNVDITSGVCTISQNDLLDADMIANKGASATGTSGASGGAASGGNIGSWSGGNGGDGAAGNGYAGGGGGGIISNTILTATGGNGRIISTVGCPGSGAGWAVRRSADGHQSLHDTTRCAALGGVGFAPDSNYIADIIASEPSSNTFVIPAGSTAGGRSSIPSDTVDSTGGDGKYFAGGGAGRGGGDGGYGGGGGGSGDLAAGTGGAAVAVFIISENGKWF